MRKIKITKPFILMFVFAIGIIGVILFILINNETILHAGKTNAVLYTNPEKIKPVQYKKDINAVSGTEANPYLVIEIAPYRGLGELSYMAGGSEPLDLNEIALHYHENVGETSVTLEAYFSQIFGDTFEYAKDYYKIYADDIKSVEFKEEHEKIFGTEEIIKLDNWTKSESEDAPYYYRAGLRNKEPFKQALLSTKETDLLDQFYLKIVTVTPDELNRSISGASGTLPDYIDQADFVYISQPQKSDASICYLYESYSKKGKNEIIKYANSIDTDSLNGVPDFYQRTEILDGKETLVYNDLEWASVMKIFNKVAKKRIPIVFDTSIAPKESYSKPAVSDSGAELLIAKAITKKTSSAAKVTYSMDKAAGYYNNIAKLYLMCTVMDPGVFYELFIQPESETGKSLLSTKIDQNKDHKGMETGYLDVSLVSGENEDTKLYWNWNTFVRVYEETFNNKDVRITSSEDYADKEAYWKALGIERASHTEFVKRNVFGIVGDGSLNSEFSKFSSQVFQIKEYAQNDTTIYKKKIQVLDIEPCNEFALSSQHIRSLLAEPYSGDMVMTEETSSAFVGKLANLKEDYDLIYMGLNDGRLNKNGDGSTNYADDNLDGKIYLHVGDLVNSGEIGVSAKWTGLFTSTAVRMPGNDITELKANQLKEYVDSSMPLLLVDNLYNPDNIMVDKASNVYKFALNVKSKDNVLKQSSSNISKKLCQYLNQKKLTLTLHKYPAIYNGDISDPNNYNPATKTFAERNYINGNGADGKLSFRFTVHNGVPEKKYRINLYVDNNSDGQYSKETELVYFSSAKFENNGTYDFSFELTKDYLGCVAWKFELEEAVTGNTASKTGISAVKLDKSERRTIRVLQINKSNNSTLNLQRSLGQSTAESISMDGGGVVNNVFKTYTENLNDYDLKIETIASNNFEKRFQNNSYKNPTDDQLVNNYDMLIFGFADYYSDISNSYGALNNVLFFIDSGKSVLFTHDITSYNNQNEGQEGFGFNKLFRGYLGMDRFGVRIGKDQANDQAEYYNSAGKLSEYKEIHGYTLGALKRLCYGGNGLRPFPELPNDWVGGGTYNEETSLASKLNGGRITEYPYKILDKIPVSGTHNQYYQLDLNTEDITVWYCLASDNTDNLYNILPDDAANSYYIYNKGNITYSGVGHSNVDASNVEETRLFINTMIMAYRNAIERPSVEAADIDAELIDAEGTFGRTYDMRILKNYEDKFAADENEKRYIKFTPLDNNFLGMNLLVSAYVPVLDANGNEIWVNGEREVTKLEIFDEDGNPLPASQYDNTRQCYILQRQYVYTVKYPMSYMKNEKTQAIYFDVTRKLTNKDYTGHAVIRLKYFGLFKLD